MMKTLITIISIFISTVAFGQTKKVKATNQSIKNILAITHTEADFRLEKPLDKAIKLKEGDTVKLIHYGVTTKLWKATYQQYTGYVKDSLLIQESALVSLKNDIIAKEFLPAMQKKYGAVFGRAIYDEEPVIGMTKRMFLEFMPQPDEINKSTGSWGIHEQWVYNDRPSGKTEYYYFENGKLTSWQD